MTHIPLDLEDFLKRREDYRLGELLTESSHPQTQNLSELALHNLPRAYQIFQKIDLEALGVLESKASELVELESDLREVLNSGGRVFISGCGATGRLALTLERCWREAALQEDFLYEVDQLVAFMAGGDLALVKSIESFEDREDFGARQLEDLGFREGDLLLAVTEGGETPFVIGACEASVKYSSVAPHFLYANPDSTLKKLAKRSERVLLNPKIKKLNLTHSAQALSGSTRLQASSVLMMAVGQALSSALSEESLQPKLFDLMIKQVSSLETTALSELTLFEQECLESDQSVYYTGRPEHLISIFTDTTERSPTFSLTPFEHDDERSKGFHSANYLYLDDPGPESVWRKILGRKPRALSWPEVKDVAGEKRLQGYDFSSGVLKKREPYFNSHEVIRVFKKQNQIGLQFHHQEISFSMFGSGQKFYDLLLEQLVIKLCLNAHSTLMMGRMGRYEGNLMTYVRPSNFKLIDRACRYAEILLRQRGVEKVDEEKLVRLCFEIGGKPGPVVLNLVRVYLEHS